MSAKGALSGSEGNAAKETAETKKPSGSGTSVSGYIDDPKPKRCNTCEYFKKPNLCTNKVVMKDPKVKTAKDSKFKIVAPVTGCCSYWESNDEED